MLFLLKVALNPVFIQRISYQLYSRFGAFEFRLHLSYFIFNKNNRSTALPLAERLRNKFCRTFTSLTFSAGSLYAITVFRLN